MTLNGSPEGETPRTRSRRRSRHRGQAIVETALVLPIFLILVLAIVDFGLGLRAWITVTNAAREGARVAAVRGSCSAIEAQVMDTSGGLISDAATQIIIDPPTCNGTAGSPVSVTATYEYNFVTPLAGLLGGVIPSSWTIESESVMRVE